MEVKEAYQDFDITIERNGGENKYLICRESDGLVIYDTCEMTSDVPKTMMRHMRGKVDDYYKNPEDYE